MNKKAWAIVLVCAALILSACGAASDAPNKSTVPASEGVQSETSNGAGASGESDADGGADASEEAEAETDGGADAPEESEAGEIADASERDDDFSPLAGTWSGDESSLILTVYDNGGFLLDDPDNYQEGYLVYTEADGDLWESGPRYELYLENNERLEGVSLAFDENHPGKLVYAVSGGAELLYRWDSLYDENGVVLRVQRADDTVLPASGYDEFTAYEGEYQVSLVFTTERALRDFKFLSVSFADTDESGAVFFNTEELYAQDELTSERPFVVRTSFPGDMPTNGVSYIDENGVTQYFAVGDNGYDGSLVFSYFQPTATP